MLKLLLSTATAAAVMAQQELLVETQAGKIQGHYNEVGVREWDGIPYARPPVGENRFEQSVPHAPWSDVYTADFMAPGCPQDCKLPPGTCPEYGTSEDCLYLTVFSPTEPPSDPAGYPVYFWVHGGSFEQGLGDCSLYNGTDFATNGVVSVVINYRLGALGFMASESMQGNYGLLDQKTALQWTIDNIRAFNGNPDAITLGGQSAGGMSVGAHLTAESATGMFQLAVMESNPLALPFHTRESATPNAKAVFEYCGCTADDIACMKTKPAELIVEAQNKAPSIDLENLLINFLPFSPLVTDKSETDGYLHEQPFTALGGGRMQPMPMLSGTVRDEGQLFVYELFPETLNEKAYSATLLGVFGKEVFPELIRMYPFDMIDGVDDGRVPLATLATDLIFYCPLRNATRGYQQALGADAVPTYQYRFDHVISFDCWGPEYWFCVDAVCHGSELLFEFDVYSFVVDGELYDFKPTEEEKALIMDVSHLWTNFITGGDPNKGLPSGMRLMPLYRETLDELLVLQEPAVGIVSHQRELYCDFWDRAGYFY